VADDHDVIPLSRFSALLQRVRGSKRLEALLEATDAAARVAALPVQDLYFLIKEVGLADAGEVLALATSEQVQGFLDLDAWDRDRLDEQEVVPWLDALLEARAEDGGEKFTHVWRNLDPELTALLLKRWSRIYQLAEEDVPEDEEPPFIPTPDRYFMLKVTAHDPAVVSLLERIIDRLYRVDAEQARHTIRAAATEPFAELEETSYRWRSGRMQDMGYADYHEALEVYRPIDLGKISIGEGTADRRPEPITLPATLADKGLDQPFLSRVLRQIVEPGEARRLEAGMAMLFNRALSADRVEPGDAEAAKAGATRAGATLSLGLETIAGGNVDRGLEALRTISLVRLHRIGFTVGNQMSGLVKLLGRGIARAEEPYASVLTALLAGRPSYARVLDDPPGVGVRPLASLEDVRRMTHAVGILAAQLTIVTGIGGLDPSAHPPEVSLGDLGRTLLVHAVLQHPVHQAPGSTIQPLTRADLTAFRQHPDPRGGAQAALRAAAPSPDQLPEEFAAAIYGWMDDLSSAAGEQKLMRLILE
jgi:hypothetical protein